MCGRRQGPLHRHREHEALQEASQDDENYHRPAASETPGSWPGLNPLPMLRDNDESSGIDCPVCHRTFSTFARMDDHLAEHEGPKKCRQCGEIISSEDVIGRV